MYKDILNLVDEFKSIEEVEAFALGGSRASGRFDKKSDYDVYVYITDDIPDIKRQTILEKYCSIMEISNMYWEKEDNCTLNNGIDIDIIYRKIEDFSSDIKSVAEDCIVHNGYTTCMWYNLMNCQIIFDKKGRLTELQKKYNIPYPAKLKKNIIRRNFNLLSGVLPSYDLQIKKAVERKDIVSINHRVTEFLASYFDIIFAVNEMLHPGEKRLVSICVSQCKILPKNFEENLNLLFSSLFEGDKLNEIISDIVNELREIIF